MKSENDCDVIFYVQDVIGLKKLFGGEWILME